MMELNHLSCKIWMFIYLALPEVFFLNWMNISAVINDTMNHITSKQIASITGKKQILFRAIMAFAHCRWRRLASLYCGRRSEPLAKSQRIDGSSWMGEGRKEKDPPSQKEKEGPRSRVGSDRVHVAEGLFQSEKNRWWGNSSIHWFPSIRPELRWHCRLILCYF